MNLNELRGFNTFQLLDIQKYIDGLLDEKYNDPDAFMTHTTVDNYFYMIEYENGETMLDCIGKRQYERFLNDSSAIRIYRREKWVNGKIMGEPELLIDKTEILH